MVLFGVERGKGEAAFARAAHPHGLQPTFTSLYQARVLGSTVENQELLDDLTVKESKKLILLAKESHATPWPLPELAAQLVQISSVSAEREQQGTPQNLVSPSIAIVSLSVSSTDISPNAQSTADSSSVLVPLPAGDSGLSVSSIVRGLRARVLDAQTSLSCQDIDLYPSSSCNVTSIYGADLGC
nr:hypothetical protein Iba_chr08bCG10990 [Ipomoea batatas]